MPDSAVKQDLTPERGALEATAVAGDNRRILLVDDNRAIHEDFNKILGGGDADDTDLDDLHRDLFGADEPARADAFELSSAFQGEEALRMVGDARRDGRPYALAFMDVRMPPGIDGLETTRRMLEEDSDIGIVVCSAYSDHTWTEMARAFGNTDRVLILKKPFDTIEVRQLAHALQRRWELQRLAEMKVGELTSMVDAQTAELRAANERLEVEALEREDLLRQREETNAQIRMLAYHDGLTGLPNRRRFNEMLDHILARAKHEGSEFAVLFIDCDNFKRINDTVGHHAADEVLKQLADGLQLISRAANVAGLYDAAEDDCVVSRLGGDEFTVLLPSTRDRFSAGVVAQRILGQLAKPIRAGEHELFVTASIGIATYPDDGDRGETLVRNADTAMYHAKELGKAAYQYYSESMNAASIERLALEAGLRRAFDEKLIDLYFQPQVDLSSGRIIGSEALLRWNDPERGDIAPTVFIPIAEETGLILPISEWALNEACFHVAEWQRAGLPTLPVSVNVSVVQLSRQDLCGVVRRAVALTGLDPGLLELEITETAIMSVQDRFGEVLAELRTLGVGLSLDDFGTGYSSLSYLKDFPIQTLKIDRSFVSEIVTNTHAATITEAIISMAHVLGLRVIAEGVETEGEVELLKRWKCDVAQGFYYSPAVAPERFAEFLAGAPMGPLPS